MPDPEVPGQPEQPHGPVQQPYGNQGQMPPYGGPPPFPGPAQPGRGAGFPQQAYGQPPQPFPQPPPYGQVPGGRPPGTGNKALILVLVGVLVAAVAGVGIYFVTDRSKGGGTSGPQLTSRQLAAALLPASYFGSGYTAQPKQLGSTPNASTDNDAVCKVMLGEIDVYGTASIPMDPGATAQAATFDVKPDPGTGTGVSFAQSVEQFPGTAQAAALMDRMSALLRSCNTSGVGATSFSIVSTDLGVGEQSIEAQTTGVNPVGNVPVGSKVVVMRKGQDLYEAVLLFGTRVSTPDSPTLTSVVDDLAANVAQK